MDTKPVIHVTWMDGQTKVYRNVEHHGVADGVLTITQAVPRQAPLVPEIEMPRLPCDKTLHLPVANIREVVVESSGEPEVRIKIKDPLSRRCKPKPGHIKGT
jgi:hypothetical protein